MLSKFLYRVLLATIALLSVNSSYSQLTVNDTINLESVTIYRPTHSNTKLGLKSVSIDTLAIAQKRALSLSALLQENTSIFVKTYGRGATATASMRGTSASHTNVYWNGIKINSPMSGEADFSLVPLYFVDDVAIHFGQASMGLGSGGLGGAISLKSRPNWNRKFGAQIYQSVGSYKSLSTAVATSYSNGKLTGQTRLYYESSANDFSFKNTAKIGNPIEIQKNADYAKQGLLQEFYYRHSANSILSARIWAQQTSRGIPQLMTNFAVKEENRQDDTNLNSIIEFQNTGNDLSWKLTSGFSNMNINYAFSKTSTEGNHIPILNSNSTAWTWFNQGMMKWESVSWISANLQLELNNYWINSSEAILKTGYKTQQLQGAIRAAVTTTPLKSLKLNLLISNELYNNKTTPLSTSISASYKLFKRKELYANGGVSRNYHHPSLNDLYWQPGGNENLLPEDAFTQELGLSYSTKSSNIGIDASANIFASQIRNWIMWLPHLKGYWEPVNLTQVTARGAELSVSASKTIARLTLKASGNYSYTLSTIENAGGIMRAESHGKQLPFIPVHSGGLVVNALWKKFHIVYSFTHFSERYTTTSNNPNSMRRLYPYYMSSAAIGYDFKLKSTPLALQLRADNILNESYQTILWRPMPGRNFSLILRIDL